MVKPLEVFVDESGQRGMSSKASPHFILSAVMFPADAAPAVSAALTDLKVQLGRRPTDPLHFQNLKQHSHRVAAAQGLAGIQSVTVTSVIVCKHALPKSLNDDQAYLYTLRLLLERVSWFARDHGYVADYTLAAIVRFPLQKLRDYEAKLRGASDCRIDWGHLDPRCGQIDQPARVPFLQLADIAASSIGQAFNPDAFGNTETRYLREALPRMWRYGGSASALTSYGLKMHPSKVVDSDHPWVKEL